MTTAVQQQAETSRFCPGLRFASIALVGILGGLLLGGQVAAQDPIFSEPDPLAPQDDPLAPEVLPTTEPDPFAPAEEIDLPDQDHTRSLPERIRALPGVRQGMDDKELLRAAQDALETRQLDDAETLLDYLVLQRPDLFQARSLLAFTCELQMEALSDPQTDSPARAEAYQKNAVRHYLEAGNLALEQGAQAGARKLFERVMRYEPANPQMKLGLARYYANVDQKMLAIEHYNEYIKSNPGQKDSQAWLELGRIYHRSGFTGQAVTTLQKAVNMNPDNPETHFALAVVYLDDKRIDRALDVARTAMQKGATKPNYHKYVNLFARVLLAGNRLDEAAVQAVKAIRLAREALARQPDDAGLLSAVVSYHDTLERTLKARINIQPQEASFRIDLARSIADRSSASRLLNLHAALRTLPPLEGENRGNIELLELAAELQFAVQKHADAAETCKRLLELDAGNSKANEILQRLPAELRPTARAEPDAGDNARSVSALP